MEKELVLYEERDGTGLVTLNRPRALNALGPDMLVRLSQVLDRAAKDVSVRAVIITGSGDKAFSAGADIGCLSLATPLEARDLARLAVSVNRKIETSGKLAVAAINGFALGGGLELAEACALRVAAPHASLGHPEVAIGAVAGWGGTTRLPRLVGRGRAAELLLTGRRVTAEEALAMGLVNRVSRSRETLLEEARALVEEVLSRAPLSVAMTWEAMRRGLDMTAEESAALGADLFGLIASTEDFREGTRAFLEKRKPRFKGR